MTGAPAFVTEASHIRFHYYYVLFVVAQKPIRQVYDPKASPQRPHQHGNASLDSAERGIRPCSCRAVRTRPTDNHRRSAVEHKPALRERILCCWGALCYVSR
jgi:hypothetical protein